MEDKEVTKQTVGKKKEEIINVIINILHVPVIW